MATPSFGPLIVTLRSRVPSMYSSRPLTRMRTPTTFLIWLITYKERDTLLSGCKRRYNAWVPVKVYRLAIT